MTPSSSAATTRAQRRWLPNALLAAGSVLFGLLAFELGVRAFVDLGRWKPIPVHDVDLARRIAFLPGSERVYETAEFRYTLKTNRFGRRDREWSEADLADPGALLFIGDSFVMGASVEEEHAIPTLLEDWLRRRGTPHEVLNFGMAATGLPHYVEILKDALQIGVKAHSVLVGVFVGNDFQPDSIAPAQAPAPADARPASPPRFRSALLDFLRLRVSNSTRFVGLMLELDRRLGIRLYTTPSSYIFLRDPPREQAEIFERILARLGEIQEICAREGRDLYVVLFPNKIQVENRESLSSSVYDPEKPNRRIAEYCASRGIRCWDQLPVLVDAYRRGGRELYFPVDRHLTETGNRIAADAIAGWLERTPAFEEAVRVAGRRP
jgi:hypothetical protein